MKALLLSAFFILHSSFALADQRTVTFDSTSRQVAQTGLVFQASQIIGVTVQATNAATFTNTVTATNAANLFAGTFNGSGIISNAVNAVQASNAAPGGTIVSWGSVTDTFNNVFGEINPRPGYFNGVALNNGALFSGNQEIVYITGDSNGLPVAGLINPIFYDTNHNTIADSTPSGVSIHTNLNVSGTGGNVVLWGSVTDSFNNVFGEINPRPGYFNGVALNNGALFIGSNSIVYITSDGNGLPAAALINPILFDGNHTDIADVNSNGVSVHTNLTVSGLITGNGSGLTNIPATGIIGTSATLSGNQSFTGSNTFNASVSIQPDLKLGSMDYNGFSQNLALWLSSSRGFAISGYTLTNGQSVSVSDYSPSNNTVALLNGAVTFDTQTLKGRPSFYFGANTRLEVTNLFVGFGTNVTICVTFKDIGGSAAGQTFIWTAGGSTRPGLMRGWIDNAGVAGNSYSGGEVYYGFNGNHGGVQQRQFQNHVACAYYNGTNFWCTLDGKPAEDDRIQPFNNTGQLSGWTNFFIGGDITAGSYFKGYISDLRIYNTTITGQYADALERQLCDQAGIPLDTIILGGDSISQGLHTDALLGTPAGLLNRYFSSFQISTEANSGRTSAMEYQNALRWMPNVSRGQNFYHLLVGVNDFFGLSASACSNQVPLTFANITNILNVADSNGIACVVGTLTSVYWETNGTWRTLLNNQILGLTNRCVVADYSTNAIGTNGAYANAALLPDGVHPNAAGYTNFMTTMVPALNSLIYHK